MSAPNDIAGLLSERSRRLESQLEGPEQPEEIASLPESLLQAVEAALLAGETHYTVRPGIPELRRLVLEEISRAGGPEYPSPDSALITSGAEEAVFVALLGLRPEPGVAIVACDPPFKEAQLFRLLGLEPQRAPAVISDQPELRLLYREAGLERKHHQAVLAWASGRDLPDILNLGGSFASRACKELPPLIPDRTLIAGSFDSLPGVSVFRAGFLAGPEPLLRRIRPWKQAFSICSAAPTQRAALHALAGRREQRP